MSEVIAPVECKKIVITGGSRGIGAAVAKSFGSQHQIVATATTQERAADLTAQTPSHISGIALDLSDPEGVSLFWEQMVESLGGEPDILINNAGVTEDTLFMRMKEESFARVLQINLAANFSLSKRALKSMIRRRWGRVINMSSVVATSGNVGQANYIAAKAGLEGLTRALAQEVASRGVTVNAIAPGFIETDMTRAMSDKAREAILQRVPMKRMGSPEEVAGLIQYLASDEASYITGQTIHINGGLLMG